MRITSDLFVDIVLGYFGTWKRATITFTVLICAITQFVFAFVLTSPPTDRVDVELCQHYPSGVKVDMFGDYLLHGENAQDRIDEIGYVRTMLEAEAVAKAYVMANGKTYAQLINNFPRGHHYGIRLVENTKRIKPSKRLDPHKLIFDMRLNIKEVKLP
ncbi:hypothetical protein KAR91_85875 [Candidatus Pacearchaeota archaeon]|nr:hypothetical protein [Candidatus Pacearchaeota archaeon]